MPVNDATLREKKKAGVPPLAIVIGLVVVLGGAGFWYLDRASHRPPPGPPPLTAEARAYTRNLGLSGVEMQAHTSYLNQQVVEITGNLSVMGRVDEIGLRYTKLTNFYNQEVFIPNRTIANVSRFPQGGVDAYADPQIPFGADQEKAIQIIASAARGMWSQFGAIILGEPILGKVETAQGGGWNFLRVHFKIWPGQGNLIETVFRQQVVKAMKAFEPGYADWQVPVTYRAMVPVTPSEPWHWRKTGGRTPGA